MTIERLTHLDKVDDILAAADLEGCRFVDRLKREWEDGTNCFARPDELLLGATVETRLIGVAGLNWQVPGLGRVRHVFVLPEFRRRGIATALVAHLLAFAEPRYREVVLRTDSASAAKLYESLGFMQQPNENDHRATHRLRLSKLRIKCHS